ncbi:hypothetical protein [Chitinophaga defluvii]|uniref:Uncharacterized protein n=1 Tax=Chitinophaga defluvii TaxID=3163343 RepID=A0ABV2T7T5_9BACT
MFTGISWTTYLSAVAILLVIYYLYVGVRYFSGDLKDLLAGKKKFKLRPAPPGDADDTPVSPFQPSENTLAFEEATDSDFQEVEELIGRLKDVIADASQRELIPQEFRQYLRMTLKEYPAIKNSPLRLSVNELIVSECEKYGTVTLSAEKVDEMWNGSL